MRRAGSLIEVRFIRRPLNSILIPSVVSRLRARSKNYDMDMTLDYNNELFPLKSGQSFALALASSLQRGGASKSDGAGDDGEEKEQDVWRPDGKGRRGLEDDYHYVMYGKVGTLMLLGRTE